MCNRIFSYTLIRGHIQIYGITHEPPSNPNWVIVTGVVPGPEYNLWFSGRVNTRMRFHFLVPLTLAPIKYRSSDCIVTWLIRWMCSFSSSSTCCFQIWDRTNIRSIGVKQHHIPSNIHRFSIVTEQILIWSQIWRWEVREQLTVRNLRIDHVTIRSELRYIIGATIVNLKCRAFGGKTGPFWTVQVFLVERPIATGRYGVEPVLEPSREFGTTGNTTSDTCSQISVVSMAQSTVSKYYFLLLF